jgi:hypothetical protein
MAKRTPIIYSLTEQHGPQQLEESYPNEPVSTGVIYIDRYTWRVIEVSKIQDVPEGALEIPKTTWFG